MFLSILQRTLIPSKPFQLREAPRFPFALNVAVKIWLECHIKCQTTQKNDSETYRKACTARCTSKLKLEKIPIAFCAILLKLRGMKILTKPTKSTLRVSNPVEAISVSSTSWRDIHKALITEFYAFSDCKPFELAESLQDSIYKKLLRWIHAYQIYFARNAANTIYREVSHSLDGGRTFSGCFCEKRKSGLKRLPVFTHGNSKNLKYKLSSMRYYVLTLTDVKQLS